MLNRVYIVIGVIAILILAAAFVVPQFIPWNNYRGRLEALAAEALGTRVQIAGDVHFALLPQPHLVLGDVTVGPAANPVIGAKSLVADFSLVDFLRDRYSMTHLVLDHPVLDLTIDKKGGVETGLKPAGSNSRTSLSIANAQVEVGTVRVTDARSGAVYQLDGIVGRLSVGAIDGPFGFQGGGSFGDQHYVFNVTTAALDAAGNTQISLFAHPDNNSFSLSAEGSFATRGAPRFIGNATYRRHPPTAANSNGVVGDLTFVSKVDAGTDRVVLSGFTLTPDENRGVTRLTGSATVTLGAKPGFVATVSSGVLALPPRDATTEQGPQPYELVRMLGELPAVPVPPIAGRLSADVSDLDLRSFALRNVKLAATTNGKAWAIEDFSGQLPGSTTLGLAGALADSDGRPSFSGTVSIRTARLDTLSAMWRKPAEGTPLFGMPGSFKAKLALLGQTMALTDGNLVLDGVPHPLTALIKYGAQRRIDLSARFADLDASDSAALLALAPDVGQDPRAAVTFPQGAVSLAADSATLFGLAGHGLELEGKWGDGALELSKFAASDLGGVGFDLSAAISGSLAAPRIAGDGDIKLSSGDSPALARLYDALGTPSAVRDFVGRSLPADLKVHVDDPKDDGGQGLSLAGTAGVADLNLDARLDGGLLKALTGRVNLDLELDSKDPRGLTRQLGLGDVSLMPETGPVKLTATLNGLPTGTLDTKLGLAGGGDFIRFDGKITPGDLTAVSGTGKLAAKLADSSVLASDFGITGIATPPVDGTADLRFAGSDSVALEHISGKSGQVGFSGRLSLTGSREKAAVSGALTVDSVDTAGLVALLAGPTSLITSSGNSWPDGPISVGDSARTTAGNIDVEVPEVMLGGKPLVHDAGFVFGWDGTHLSLGKFAGTLAGGKVGLEVSVCCAGPASDKQANGSVSISGVPLAAVLPPAPAGALGGTLDASARFSLTGDSILAMLRQASGDGSFSLANLSVQHFDPQAFAEIAAINDIINLEPKDLSAKVAAGLDAGPFEAAKLGGGFTIAGGVLRLANLAAATPAARLFGGLTVKLDDLGLGGSFSLTPVGTLDKAGIVSATTAQVVANLSGTVPAPQRTLDVAGMVEAIKVKALEAEVARLEALKAADDARAKAAAEKAAADKAAADKAAADKAAADKAAADKAAADKAAADAAAKKAAQPKTPPPMDLQMPPPQFFQPLN